METNSLCHHTDLCSSEKAEGDHCHTFPRGESDQDSDMVTNPGYTGNLDHLQSPKTCSLNSNIAGDSEPSYLGVCVPLSTTTEISSSSPTVNSNVNPTFASQPDEKGLCGGEEPTQTPRNASNKHNMEQEEMETEIMWKLRANRVKQILSSLTTEFGQFTWSRRAGLEFNVGFGPKKNIIVDSLPPSVLLEVAKFALAMNSSQQDFIMEILEYNFDFGLQNQHQRDLFTCEIMNRVRKLRSGEDAVKFSKEVFQLPGSLSSINVKNQSVGNVNIELSSKSRMAECGITPGCPHSNDETKEHISEKVVICYPFCDEIGLKLHVNQCQPNTKLDITKLTNGAMTEVTNFAERLCGTFEQICLDVLRHNLDLDSQSGDSDLARDLIARIPTVVEQKNLSHCVKAGRYKQVKGKKNRHSEKAKLDCQDDQNLDECSASSSKVAIIYQNVGNSLDIEQQKQLHLKLWKLRANHIEHILSVPHGEHCPLYSYRRCKKLGIDFNVGFGVKQNLDPKLLTNGIMVELNTFATALLSAQKYFITDILEYNFHLNFKSELHRSVFGQRTLDKVKLYWRRKNTITRASREFELPDTRWLPDLLYYRTTYCPKCYQDRNQRLYQDKSDPGHIGHLHPHTMLHTVSADENCTEQQPPEDLYTVFSTLGRAVMADYPLCKKIGLNPCVDKNQPKDKLDIHLLTYGTMTEVVNFTKIMCGTKKQIINDILEHNFDINMQGLAVYPSRMLHSIASDDGEEAWFNEVFVIPPFSPRQHGHASKLDDAFAMQRDEMNKNVNKRKLALQTKKESATLPSLKTNVAKNPRKNRWTERSRFPICMEIGLDLDVTSKPAKKKKLDLRLLTKAVVLEIYKFVVRKTQHYLPQSLYDILDYNFDLRSQHDRRWEFAMATAFEVQSLVKQYRKKQEGADEVFELPFVFTPKSSSKPKKRRRFGGEEQTQTPGNVQNKCDMKQEGMRTEISYTIPLEESDLDSDIGTEYDMEQEESGTENSFPCPQGESDQDSDNGDDCGMEQEEMGTESNYTCPLGESDLDSDNGDDCGMEQEEMGTESNYTCPLGESDLDSDIGKEFNMEHEEMVTERNYACPLGKCDLDPDKTRCLDNCVPSLTLSDVSATLPAVNSNVNPPFVCLPDKRGLCEGKEQTQTPRDVPNKCDMEQEDIGAENLWKLRANRVKQILSEFGPFHWYKKVGIEFNVGFAPKQNISVDCLSNSLLIEVAKFALAMNSSQQYFIMEILENNFDFYFESEDQRNTVTCEIMETVRQLKDSRDADRDPGEAFDLPHSITARDQEFHSVSSINPELRSVSIKEECDVTPICHLRLHAETKKHTSLTSLDPYPVCKKIGLKLHVNQHQQNEKLDLEKLTNGAVTEVTNFAEQLCGTFEQICLDILRHNFDLDLQSGESDLGQSILARIPTAVEQKNLSTCVQSFKLIKNRIKGSSRKARWDCQNSPKLDACSAGSSQAATIDKNVGSSPEPVNQKELNSMLWKLRANYIREILSVHEEHCPLYSYSRCRKAGIDFNVGSGVKQNLDPELLTNGIMVEICTFATALLPAKKHFITEILEYNFHLNFKSELHRRAFAQQTRDRITVICAHKTPFQMKMPFKLPDTQSIQEPKQYKTAYCPKCYQEREHRLRQEETGHMHYPRPHTTANEVSADANCKAQKLAKGPSSTFAAIEEKIMDCYPQCKKTGLSLCVNKDQPKDKLDKQVLTIGIMVEVAKFAEELCSTKADIINAVLEHNVGVVMQRSEIDTFDRVMRRVMAQRDVELTWFSEVFVSQPTCHRKPGHAKELDEASAKQISERRETINKRKLALQTKEKGPTLLSHDTAVEKSKTDHQIEVPVNCYPICTEIGLDLDITSKSRRNKKMDLKLLTGAVVLEIHNFASEIIGHNFPRTVYDILDYNFDLSSQHHRRWDFARATASKVQTMVKNYHKYGEGADEVFELPFVWANKKRPNREPQEYSQENPNKKKNEGRFVRQVIYHFVSNCVYLVDGFKNNEEPWSYEEDTEVSTDPVTMVEMNGSLMTVVCDSHLQGNTQKKEGEFDPHHGNMKPEPDTGTFVPMSGSLVSEYCGSPLQANTTKEEYNPHYGNMKPEPDTEEKHCPQYVKPEPDTEKKHCPQYDDVKPEPDTEKKHCPQYDDVKTEPETEGAEHSVPSESTELLGYTQMILCPNSDEPQTESENQYVQYYILTDTQGSAECLDIKTELDTECVQYLVPVEAAGSQEYTIVIIDQGNGNTVIKEEQENVQADSHHY